MSSFDLSGGSRSPEGTRGTPADVLVVDDDAQVRRALLALLRMEGFSAVAAANGQEALDLLRGTAPPRLILLDLAMPEMDGWTFRERQLADPELAAIPVVILSGAPLDDPRSARLRPLNYFPKPFHLRLLLETVASVCRP